MARRRQWLVGITVLLFVGGVLAGSVHPELPAAELEARDAAPPSRFIEVDGLRIHYRDQGQGPAAAARLQRVPLHVGRLGARAVRPPPRHHPGPARPWPHRSGCELREGNGQATRERLRASADDGLWRRPGEVRAPTLVLWGAKDGWILPAYGERFDRDVPDSQFLVYPDLGHVPMEEDPARTAGDVRRFLAGDASSGDTVTAPPAPASGEATP